jgi:phosphatidylinositol glycan class P protein
MAAAEYAFVSWIGTIIVYLVFICWVLVPCEVLHAVGITYYPDKYYAVALPSLLIVSGLLLGVAYVGLNMWNTFDPDDIRTVEDSVTRYSSQGFHFTKNLNEMGTPDIADIDICSVSLMLHSNTKKTKRRQHS